MGDYYESVMMSALVFMFLTASTTHGFILVLYLADYFIKSDLYLKYYLTFIYLEYLVYYIFLSSFTENNTFKMIHWPG